MYKIFTLDNKQCCILLLPSCINILPVVFMPLSLTSCQKHSVFGLSPSVHACIHNYVSNAVSYKLLVGISVHQTTDQIFVKILPQMYLWTGKNWLYFGSHLLPDPDPGIFWRILHHSEMGHFATIRLIPLDRVIVSPRKFCHKCNIGQGSPR